MFLTVSVISLTYGIKFQWFGKVPVEIFCPARSTLIYERTIKMGSGLISISENSKMARGQVSPAQTSSDPQSTSRELILYIPRLVYIGELNDPRHRSILRYTDTSSHGPIVTKIYEGFIVNADETTGPAYPTLFFSV